MGSTASTAGAAAQVETSENGQGASPPETIASTSAVSYAQSSLPESDESASHELPLDYDFFAASPTSVLERSDYSGISTGTQHQGDTQASLQDVAFGADQYYSDPLAPYGNPDMASSG